MVHQQPSTKNLNCPPKPDALARLGLGAQGLTTVPNGKLEAITIFGGGWLLFLYPISHCVIW